MPTPSLASEQYERDFPPAYPRRYWIAALASLCAGIAIVLAATYSPRQDQPGAISLHGDNTWYYNYEPNFEIQDNDVFYHGIGASIGNAQQADIIFLGTSKVLFALDRHEFAAFEARHHLKMFNMAFAGVPSGEFSARIIRRWNLHPKLWVIDLFSTADVESMNSSFFNRSLASAGGFGNSAVSRVLVYSDTQALKNVAGRNLRWQMKDAVGLLMKYSYRSAVTGNWDVDMWPGYSNPNPAIDGTVGTHCPAPLEEIDAAKHYAAAIGGQIVLTQIPSVFYCDQRVRDLATALNAPAFVVPADKFSSEDGGGHLDVAGARKYSRAFFAWLEQLPEFKAQFSP